MEQRRKPLANSLAARGLRRFMSEEYPLFGGYVKLIDMLKADASNADIARAFSPEDRPMSKEAPRRWRARWELEKQHPELENGGAVEDLEEARA
jgi:hypothetical protein